VPATILAIISAVALAIATISLIALHVNPGEFNPIRDAVSLYVHARHGVLYRVQVAATGIAALCLLGAMVARSHALPQLGLAMLGLYGACRLAITAFPSDRTTPLTQRGRVHVVLALVTFVAIAVAAGRLTGPVQLLPFWHGPAVLLSAAEIVTIASLALIFALRSLLRARGAFGLIERGIYLGAFGWMACVLIGLLR
jgi:hypothetical protein